MGRVSWLGIDLGRPLPVELNFSINIVNTPTCRHQRWFSVSLNTVFILWVGSSLLGTSCPPPSPLPPSLYSPIYLLPIPSPSPCLLLSSPYFLSFWFRLLFFIWLFIFSSPSSFSVFSFIMACRSFSLCVFLSSSCFCFCFCFRGFAPCVSPCVLLPVFWSPLLVSRPLVSLLPSVLSCLCLSCFHLSQLY